MAAWSTGSVPPMPLSIGEAPGASTRSCASVSVSGGMR